MDLVNNKVKSKALGIGTVIEQDDSHIIVQFAAKKSTFQYPEAFRKFLTVEDDEIQQTLLAEITAADALIAEAKIKAEETRKAAEQAKLEELDAKSERKQQASLQKELSVWKANTLYSLYSREVPLPRSIKVATFGHQNSIRAVVHAITGIRY